MNYRADRFRDRQLTCVDCFQPFVWSAQQQSDLQLTLRPTTPRRCPECRDRQRGARAVDRNETLTAEERTIVCGECGITFTYESDLPVAPMICGRCRVVTHRRRRR